MILLTGCIRPADDRSRLDQEVGVAQIPGLNLRVVDGQAMVRQWSDSKLVLWAQAPVIELALDSDRDRGLRIELRNCMPRAQLRADSVTYEASAKPRPTWCVFDLRLASGANALRIAPPDWDVETRYRFADMGDIQTAMDTVHEVFEAISATPDLRFVVSTGDVVETGAPGEYELYQEKLATLDIPFFSTVGNHELTRDAERWHDLFGKFSVHFRFKGVEFSFVDSGNATLDPILVSQLESWLEAGKDRIHIFGTHYPLFDPVGARNAGFRSRNEASMLLVKLARAKVDLTLYGHVHSYYKFENAGIPAHISGGGGALPEKFDGIDRHFLIIEVDPTLSEVVSVEVSRVATP